jgi:hypothetical protein
LGPLFTNAQNLAINDGVLAVHYIATRISAKLAIYEQTDQGWQLQLHETQPWTSTDNCQDVVIGNGFIAFGVQNEDWAGADYLRIYRRHADGWQRDVEPPPPPGVDNTDGFAAMLSADGDRLLVGARGGLVDDAAWPVLYRYDGRAWQLEHVFYPAAPPAPWVGYSGLLRGNLVVFTGRRDTVGNVDGQWLHVFERDGSTWQHTQDDFVPSWHGFFSAPCHVAGHEQVFCIGAFPSDGYGTSTLRCYAREGSQWSIDHELLFLGWPGFFSASHPRLIASDLFVLPTWYDRESWHLSAQYGRDCNTDGILDSCQRFSNIDCDGNFVLDACEQHKPGKDCNDNGLLDTCEDLTLGDFDANGTIGPADLDAFDVALRGPGVYIVGDCHDTHARVFDAQTDFDIDLADLAAIMTTVGE